jgi:hypothetical protein
MKLSPITKDQALKIVKTALYIALSGALTALITYVTDNKETFGATYVVVNLALVTLKQAFTPGK